jgi:hypothetical protein
MVFSLGGATLIVFLILFVISRHPQQLQGGARRKAAKKYLNIVLTFLLLPLETLPRASAFHSTL